MTATFISWLNLLIHYKCILLMIMQVRVTGNGFYLCLSLSCLQTFLILTAPTSLSLVHFIATAFVKMNDGPIQPKLMRHWKIIKFECKNCIILKWTGNNWNLPIVSYQGYCEPSLPYIHVAQLFPLSCCLSQRMFQSRCLITPPTHCSSQHANNNRCIKGSWPMWDHSGPAGFYFIMSSFAFSGTGMLM